MPPFAFLLCLFSLTGTLAITPSSPTRTSAAKHYPARHYLIRGAGNHTDLSFALINEYETTWSWLQPVGQHMAPAAREAGGVFAAMLTALSVCSDDIIWLLPFVMTGRVLYFGSIYLSCRLVALSCSIALSSGLVVATSHMSPHHAQKMLKFMGSVFLGMYAIKLFLDWRTEDGQQLDTSQEPPQRQRRLSEHWWDEKASLMNKDQVSGTSGVDATGVAPSSSAPPHGSDLSAEKLLGVALLGSVDNLAVFTPLLASGAFSVAQLWMGVLLSSLLVMIILTTGTHVCSAAGCLGMLQKVPLWCIVSLWVCWSLSSFVGFGD